MGFVALRQNEPASSGRSMEGAANGATLVSLLRRSTRRNWSQRDQFHLRIGQRDEFYLTSAARPVPPPHKAARRVLPTMERQVTRSWKGDAVALIAA